MVPTEVSCLSKWLAIKPFHIGIELPTRTRFVSSLLDCLHELDRQMQPS